MGSLRILQSGLISDEHVDLVADTLILARLQENAFIYAEGNYIVCRGKIVAGPTVEVGGVTYDIVPLDHEHCSWITVDQFGFGTYEWYGRVNGTDFGEEYPGGFEHHHGYPKQGIICFLHVNTGSSNKYYAWCSASTSDVDGSETKVELAGQDWTGSDHLFKIVWSSTQILFYVDSALVATITTNVPQDAMGFFSEACTYKNTSLQAPATIEAKAMFKRA